MAEMEGKVALITGATSGIGRATALRFAAEGARLALVARRAAELAEVAQAIERSESRTGVQCGVVCRSASRAGSAGGGQARAIAADVTDAAEIERVVRETVEALGGIDVLVNAAGILTSGTIETTRLQDWDYMMNLNARAPFYLIQCALPHLIERRGAIVNVSSVTGIRAFPGILAYCASKAAVDQLTHCVALEVAGKGVRVNAVNPGVVVTNLHRAGGMAKEAYVEFLEHSKTTHPLGRVGQPEEVAELIYFLASPRAGWITGTSCSIDGGRSQTCAR